MNNCRQCTGTGKMIVVTGTGTRTEDCDACGGTGRQS